MNSDFKIYHCGYFLTIGEVYAIVTGEKKANEIVTEWFYLVKSEKFKYRGFVLRSRDVFPTIESFWNSETIINLKNTIFYDELWPTIKDKKNLYLYDRDIVLNEMDKHSLFSIKNSFPKFIGYIEKNTSCTSFKKYANIIKGFVIEKKELSYE